MATTTADFLTSTGPGNMTGNVTLWYTFSSLESYMATATIITCVLSSLGSILIVYTFLRFKDLRTTSRKLLVYLSLADCLSAVGHILSAVAYLRVRSLSGKNDLMCQVPAAISMFADLTSILWTGALAVYLYLAIVWNLITVANKLLWLFHVINWGLPVGIVIAAILYQVIGYNVQLAREHGHPSWCGIDPSRRDAIQWAYLTKQGWELCVFCIAGSVFLLTSLYIRNEIRRDRVQMMGRDSVTAIQSANRKLRFVPAIFVFLRIWGTVRFLLMTYDHSHRHGEVAHILLVLQVLGDNSQGFANAVLLCFCSKRVRRRLSRVFQCSSVQCPCRRKGTKFTELQACFQKRLPVDDELSTCSEFVNINSSESAPILT